MIKTLNIEQIEIILFKISLRISSLNKTTTIIHPKNVMLLNKFIPGVIIIIKCPLRMIIHIKVITDCCITPVSC